MKNMNKLHYRILFAFLVCLITEYSSFSQDGHSALNVSGRTLTDSCGEAIVLRGVNNGNIWITNFGIPEFAEIAKTKANCVRICLERKYTGYYQGNPYYENLRSTLLDSIIQAALDQKLIPIVELHDFTDGDSDQHNNIQRNLDSAVMFWTQPDILAVLKKHSRFLILNIANEPEHGESNEKEFFDACSTAVAKIRGSGLEIPIMLDGTISGQDESFFITNNNGSKLIAQDPKHKLIFSIHTYWFTEDVPDTKLIDRFKNMFESNLPFVIGEFAYDLGEKCTNTINYHLIMDLCGQYNIGYLYWWWGSFDAGSKNCLSMTNSGTFEGLANQGLEVAVTNQNSIMKTSKIPYIILNGKCSTDEVTEVGNHELTVSPNPSDGVFTINNEIEVTNVKIADLLGNQIVPTKTDEKTYLLSACTGVYVIHITMKNGQNIFKQILIR